MKKKTGIIAGALLAAGLVLTGCNVNDADVVNENISKEADNFNVARQVVFVNGITDEYLLSVEGYCQINRDGGQVTVTCKDQDGYKRHHLGLSDNVTYFVQQVDSSAVSSDHYKITYKPTAILPHLENTSGD